MAKNTFLKWIEDEARDYERRKAVPKKKKEEQSQKKEEQSQISDAVLKLVNVTKELTRNIEECGIRYITYEEINQVEDAIDAVVEETKLAHQTHTCDSGEHKGETSRAFWSDFGVFWAYFHLFCAYFALRGSWAPLGGPWGSPGVPWEPPGGPLGVQKVSQIDPGHFHEF